MATPINVYVAGTKIGTLQTINTSESSFDGENVYEVLDVEVSLLDGKLFYARKYGSDDDGTFRALKSNDSCWYTSDDCSGTCYMGVSEWLLTKSHVYGLRTWSNGKVEEAYKLIENSTPENLELKTYASSSMKCETYVHTADSYRMSDSYLGLKTSSGIIEDVRIGE